MLKPTIYIPSRVAKLLAKESNTSSRSNCAVTAAIERDVPVARMRLAVRRFDQGKERLSSRKTAKLLSPSVSRA